MKNLLVLALLCLGLVCGCAPDSRAVPTNYDPLAISRAAPAPLELVVHDAARARQIPLRVYLPASKAVMPVVLFSHGLGGTREAATYLGKHWAAHGYVAVFLQHAGSDEGVWENVPLRQRMANMKKAGNLDNFILRIGDVTAVLDQLEIWNKQTGIALAGCLDMSRVGMAGHSFGAVTTQAVSGQATNFGAGFTDKRIKAALVLSPSVPAKGDAKQAFGDVKIPWLLMTGTQDEAIIGGTAASERLRVFPALPADGQKYQLIFDKAEHSAFVDARMARDAQPRNPNHHRAIEAISTAFWDAYLRGDANAQAWLDGAGASSVLEVGDKWQKK